jgi:YD repeat-containing protein
MPDGEEGVEGWAKNLAGNFLLNGEEIGLVGHENSLIKIDSTPPRNLNVSGWPASRETSAAPHALTFEATDGTSPTNSSGVKSISVSVDGGAQSAVPVVPCTLGPCTVSGKWTLNAEALNEGVHRLIVTATDNASNVASKEFTFDVRHGSPVSVGPGSVDPTTGQLKLSATDVSLAGVGGVSRTYQSRNLTAGAEGPLGPQWAFSAGGGEGLTVLPTGSVVLAGPQGGRTTFSLKESGEYQSPLGDSNIKLESKEHVPGKGITEYVVSNATAGTATTFTQPEGTQNTAPVYAGQFGSEAAQLNAPVRDAVDSTGNVWVADSANNRLEKFSAAGVLQATYGSLGSGGGQFNLPTGVAVSQSTGHVYVADQNNNRIEELTSSGAFVKAFGWGVSDGKSEFEICTSGCRAGLGGSEPGELSAATAIALDSSGDIWVSEWGNNRVEEFSKEGAYLQKFGTKGTSNGQLEGPLGLAFSGGMLYVADSGNNRIEEFSTAGKYESKFGEGKLLSPSGLASDPKSGNLFVGDYGDARVQEFSASGALITKFGSSGSGAGQFTGPTGVAVSSAGAVYVVDTATNRVEVWTHPSWLPTTSDGPLPSDTTTYTYEAVEVEEKTTIRPREALAPPPAGVACGTKAAELKKGCRALTFEYATSTTASGENASEWSDYNGRLKKVYFHAYNPVSKVMEEPAVAQYAYDKQGRLRAEWDPRIEHGADCGTECAAPKTTYGYDAAGHVTALTPPGRASWTFTYGTISGDSNAGRLLKATQAPASSPLWNGQLPANEEAPKLSGTAQVGAPLTASVGKWSNGAVAYGFEWERCNAAGGECVPIEGAVNARYTPTIEDDAHTLVARVSASNGGGAAYAASAPSGAVALFEDHSLPSGSSPYGIATGSDKNLWITNYGTNKIAKMTLSGALSEYSLPSGSSPYGIVAGPDENLWFTDNGTSNVAKITTAGVRTEYALPTGSHPCGIAVGSDHNLWVAESGTNQIAKVTTAGAVTQYTAAAGGDSVAIAAGPDGNLWFAELAANKIGKITTAGAITEYPLPAGSAPSGVTAGPDGALWFITYSSRKIGRMTTSGSVTNEYQLPSGFTPSTIITGPDGNLWVTSVGSATLIRLTPTGAMSEYPTGGNGSFASATGPDGNLWFGEFFASKIGKVTLTPAPSENYAPGTGWTMEYHVPVSGSTPGLPTLTKAEVEKWGQKSDRPVEGMAVIPPDEPQGWPATSYKRATIDYLDELGRAVNLVSPTGGIATTEYNEANEVTRTLSADDRAAALKETGKTAEASEKLDTKTQYNAADTQITKVTAPQHTVKLSTGAEAQARRVTRNFYDEGAPGGKTYNLLTKMTVGAEYEGKEADVRTTLKSYSGQEGLGWTLRQPTSTTADPSGLDLVSKTTYDRNTGNVVETRSPGGTSETIYPPSFASAFGGAGSGSGQFNHPCGIAIDPSGNLWVVDAENGRIEKFSASGTFLASYGSKGAGNLQFQRPYGIAINPSTGNVYVGDYGNNRVEELSSAGAYAGSFGTSGSGALSEPMGVTLDAAGNVWVADGGHNRLVEFSSEGAYVRAVGAAGSGNGQLSGPIGLTISEGSLYTVDSGNDRVEQFSLTGEYLGQFGAKGSGTGQLKEPYGIAANPSTGNLYVADIGNNRVDEFSPAGRFLTDWETWGPAHALSSPIALAVGATGELYVSDAFGAKVSSWTPPEAGAAHLHYATQIGSSGSGSGQFSRPVDVAFDGEGDIWASDYGNNRIEKFSAKGAWIASYGSLGSGNEQFTAPGGIDVNKSTGNVYVADTNNARIIERSSSGAFVRKFGTEGAGKLTRPGSLKLDSAGNVWVPDINANKIFEYSSTGVFIAAYGTEGSGEVQFKKPIALAFAGENVYVADSGNHRVQELTNKGAFVRNVGTEGRGSGELYDPEGIAADAAGNLYVVDAVAGQVEEFSASGSYMATFASQGAGEEQLSEPLGDAIDAAGALYVADAGSNHLKKWSAINQAVHYTKTVYYSAGVNSEHPQCGEHPEWANLTCQVEPGAQPSDAPPSLPVTTTTYNLWDESDVKSEKMGSTTRTTTQTYDAAGRAKTSEESSTADTALPMVTNEYSAASGALVKQSTTSEGKTKTITSVLNTRGQLESYTDADGNTSKYTYDVDGRVEEMNDGKGWQIYVHDPTTGLLTELLDSGTAGKKFTATYDVEGKLLSQNYPNGMTASYAYNPVGQATQLEYVKTTHCSSSCTWFSDAIVPSIDGETRSQTSTLASESYNYDAIGRLVKVQETPAGKGCTTRIYAYDEESNRTGLTTSAPGSEGKCSEEGASSERHLYDEADRLIDPGTSYDALGNATSLPAADAGGHEMTDTYYVDNQVRTQTQSEETLAYSYDPAGRTREAASTGKTSGTVISHYSGPGEALAWTSEGSEAWTRNIPGIDGALDAIQSNGGATVLQIHDLQGNIVGTAALSETETKLISTYDSTEFGVPQPGTTPPKYAWLGATGVSTEPAQSSGASTEGGASYVPQIARDLQTAPVVPPGAFPNGQGTGSEYGAEIPGWYIKLSEEQSAATLAEYVAKQEALKRAAEEACAAEPFLCNTPSDPIFHYRAWEAQEKSEKLLRLGAAGDLTSQLGTVFGTLADYIDGWVEGHLVTEVAFSWLEEYGQFLGKCASELHSLHDSHGGCRAQFSDIGSLPDFWAKPVISYCLVGVSGEPGAVDGLGLHECTRLGYLSELGPTVLA